MPNELQDKYNTLLAAVHALDPFSESFLIDVHASYDGTDYICSLCDTDQIMTAKHTPECPVTHLRNILNATKTTDKHDFTFNDPRKMSYSDLLAEREKSLNVSFLRSGAEIKKFVDIVSDPRGMGFKSCIKSPTDNGV